MFLKQSISNYLDNLCKQGLIRERKTTSSPLCFDSNDYLNLHADKKIRQIYQRAFSLYPSGSGGSIFLSGYHANQQALEQAFAQFLGVEACVLVSSGYVANLALSALLGQLNAPCVIDKKCHASLYDGLSLAKVSYKRYLHNDLQSLDKQLASFSAVLTEGVFSMSGQIAPLKKIAALCQQKQSDLFVDEAHAFGVLGAEGKGAVAMANLTENEVPLRVIPLGKAFAAQGALLAGQGDWIEALLQTARSIIYSTAVSPALSYAYQEVLEIVAGAQERRVRLFQLVDFFSQLIKESPLQWTNSFTPIQQLRLSCPHLALHYACELDKQGIRCRAVRVPTVSKKETGLRIILNAGHQPEQLQTLLNALHGINADQRIRNGH